MSSDHANDRKRNPIDIPETASSDDGQNPKEGSKKARRLSKNLSESTPASLPVDTPEVTENATTTKAASIESIGALIQDLFCSDNAKINAALDALDLDLEKDKEKCDILVTAGGCLALVQLLKKCLEKAINEFPACDQITELNELAELTTLNKMLYVTTSLTFRNDESMVAIPAIGGVEAVVKAMQTFPKCQELQWRACEALVNLACCSIGKTKAIESCGIEVILAAVNIHLNAADVCEKVCWAMANIVRGSKENTGLLISLCGGAAVAKVRTKWSENDKVQTQVRKLAKLLAAEMKAWADEE
jgi:hypothetical protein